MALTATATNRMKDEICKNLLMSSPSTVYMPMQRSNIYYEVVKTRVGDLGPLSWFFENLKSKQIESPKAIIYCRSVSSVSSIFDHFNKCLGKYQFLDGIISNDKRMMTMFHRSIPDDKKKFVLEEFRKPDSVIRIVVATTSFELGLDFPDVSFIINYGVPRSLESFSQQSGRGGRSINQAYSLVVYQGGCVGRGASTIEMKGYAVSSKCRRAMLKHHFNVNLDNNRDFSFHQPDSSVVGCRCCDICSSECTCEKCFVAPWKVCIQNDDEDVEMDNGSTIEVSESMIKEFGENLEDYKRSVDENSSEGPLLPQAWETVVERLMVSFCFIKSAEDVLTEVGISDIFLADDLFELIRECRE